MEDLKKTWEKILKTIQEDYDISGISFKTFVSKINLTKIDNDIFFIEAPDNPTLEVVKKKFKGEIGDAIKKNVGSSKELFFYLKGQNIDDLNINNENKKSANKYNDSLYTFENFIEGDHNKFARSVAVAVSEVPGELYNPLFLYSESGLGKTHLMRAIANHILKEDKNKKVLYVTSDTFINELVNSIQHMKNEAFRKKYREIDVLLLDDIQFLSKKEGTQNEIFHTFNTLYDKKKQIVLSADRPPKELEDLHDRLRSRFEKGTVVEINIPDYETRMAILKNKAEIKNLDLSNEIISFIASNIKQNVRKLEGAIIKLLAYKNTMSPNNDIKDMDVETAAFILKDIISPESELEINVQLILEIVASHYGISSTEIKSNKKPKEIAYPRQIVMYLSRKLTDTSFKDIGEFLGKRDHTTVMHGYKKIKNDLEKDESLKRDIEVLTKKITRK